MPGQSPDDGTTLTEVLAGYASAGFDSSFSITDDAQLHCDSCEQTAEPHLVPMSSLRRMEGASDPADMFAIVALTCPHCGARGCAVLGYGPMATAEHSDVLRTLSDERGDTKLPGNSAPGEAQGDETPEVLGIE